MSRGGGAIEAPRLGFEPRLRFPPLGLIRAIEEEEEEEAEIQG